MNSVREKMLEKIIDMFSDMPDAESKMEQAPEEMLMDKKMGVSEDSPEDMKMDEEEMKPHAKIEMISVAKPEEESEEDPFAAMKNKSRAGW